MGSIILEIIKELATQAYSSKAPRNNQKTGVMLGRVKEEVVGEVKN